eukprot:gene8852-6232_t
MKPMHNESHSSSASEYVKSVVFGGMDGILTSFAIIAAAAGSNGNFATVLIFGLSNVLADGFAMGFGEYVSGEAERENAAAERMREEWEVENSLDLEIEEMIQIYMAKGLSREDSTTIVNIISKDHKMFVDFMMIDELGLLVDIEDRSGPRKQGFVMFMSFVIFGMVPLLAYCTGKGQGLDLIFFISCLLTLVSLIVLGAFKGYLVGVSMTWSAAMMALNGAMSGVVSFALGAIIEGFLRAEVEGNKFTFYMLPLTFIHKILLSPKQANNGLCSSCVFILPPVMSPVVSILLTASYFHCRDNHRLFFFCRSDRRIQSNNKKQIDEGNKSSKRKEEKSQEEEFVQNSANNTDPSQRIFRACCLILPFLSLLFFRCRTGQELLGISFLLAVVFFYYYFFLVRRNRSSAREMSESEGGGNNPGWSSSPSFSSSGGRVLGAARTVEDVILSYRSTSREEGLEVVKEVCRGGHPSSMALHDLEKGVRVFTNHNSAYVDVEEQDFGILAEEILNNSILSVLVFADHSQRIGDFEICSLSRAMQYNVSVEALTLSGLNVSDEAICLLCESLVRSRVTFIDLSNTPLEDEAGRSLAALANINPYLRTVVVTATLIAEDIQDEIDVACQFNQSNFESNNSMIDESVFREGDAALLKQRVGQVIRVKEKKVMLCVAHLFECCPNGEHCLYSHDLSMTSTSGADQTFQKALEDMFASGKDGWEKVLAPLPQEGASWRPPDEAVGSGGGAYAGKGGPQINMHRRLEWKRHQEEARRRREARERLLWSYILPASLLTVGASVGVLVWLLSRGVPQHSRRGTHQSKPTQQRQCTTAEFSPAYYMTSEETYGDRRLDASFTFCTVQRRRCGGGRGRGGGGRGTLCSFTRNMEEKFASKSIPMAFSIAFSRDEMRYRNFLFVFFFSLFLCAPFFPP